MTSAHYAMSLDAPLTSAKPDEPDSVIDTIGRDDGGYAPVETSAPS